MTPKKTCVISTQHVIMEHLLSGRLVLAALLTENMTPTSQPLRSGEEKVVGTESLLCAWSDSMATRSVPKCGSYYS